MKKMKKMKKIRLMICMVLCLICIAGLTACGNGASNSNTEKTTSKKSTESKPGTTENGQKETEAKEKENDISETEGNTQPATGKDTLVVVFSATGTTKGVAEKIAKLTDADIYEIVPAEPYTSDDLNYNDKNSRTSKEQNDKSVRPQISSQKLDLTSYKTIYIGYPIWWGEEPRIMDTFVESYNFGDITMIPFCTSGGSGIGSSGSNLAENAGSGNWKDGDRLKDSISDEDLQAWIDSYK